MSQKKPPQIAPKIPKKLLGFSQKLKRITTIKMKLGFQIRCLAKKILK